MPNDVFLIRRNADLVVYVRETSEQLWIKGHFSGAGSAIERLQFDDGMVWSAAQISSATLNEVLGTPGDDMLFGSAGGDFFSGGMGSDTYAVNHISDWVNEAPNEGNDTVTTNVSYSLPVNVENAVAIEFSPVSLTGNAADNSLTGNAAANVLDGQDGNDTLIGNGGHDVFIGGAGSDVMVSGSSTSNDLYRVSLGDGFDSISDFGGTDRVRLSAGIQPSDVQLFRSGYDLEVRLSPQQIITVQGMYSEAGTLIAARAIEAIEFFDGTTWNSADIANRLQLPPNAGDDVMTGTSGPDLLDGGGGNDLLYGLGDDDVLLGGFGDDLLDGGEGADTLRGGLGNDTYVVDDRVMWFSRTRMPATTWFAHRSPSHCRPMWKTCS
jgi:Ca2+-binding RTX toxin-like protein